MTPSRHRFDLSTQIKDLEASVRPVIERLNQTPIIVDTSRLNAERAAVRGVLDAEANTLAGLVTGPFNPESTAEVRSLLFEREGLPIVSKTPTGTPSVSSGVLQRLLKDHESQLLRSLLKIREATTIAKHLRSVTKKMTGGRVYVELSNICPTLRLYSWAISLATEARRTLVPRPGNVFVQADYRSQELSIVALLAGEDKLIEALRRGDDVHAATAGTLFRTAHVRPEQRAQGKLVNYAILFQSTPSGLAWQLDIPESEARSFLERWYETYPAIASWVNEQRDHLDRTGYVESAFGLKSFMDAHTSSDYSRQREVRRCINAQVQSVGAVFLKRSMVQAARAGLRIVLPRHDAVIVECSENRVDQTAQLLRESMAVSWRDFTFDVEIKVGLNLAFEAQANEQVASCNVP